MVNRRLRAAKGRGETNITNIRLFDKFAGQAVKMGRRPLAVEVIVQPADKSSN